MHALVLTLKSHTVSMQCLGKVTQEQTFLYVGNEAANQILCILVFMNEVRKKAFCSDVVNA